MLKLAKAAPQYSSGLVDGDQSFVIKNRRDGRSCGGRECRL